MEEEEVTVVKVTGTVAMGRTGHVHLTTLGVNSRDLANRETAIAVLHKVVEVTTPTLCSLVTWEMLMSAKPKTFSDLWALTHYASE
jgi:hypothetical protein